MDFRREVCNRISQV